MNMEQMMKQAQKLQSEIGRIQEELARERVEGVSGGGMVKVTVTGQGEIVGISIEPEVIDPEEKEMLEDLLLAAISDASRKSKELAQSRLGRFGAGLGIPGMG
ncbi:MAG TPA: YbaB/EbfC family nucleoid-associated protein [Synergistaceae bacterium]|jgi:DNA-binding YbaB/EbfC family protein|nr:MAG: Nucleoid-associated protein [Synergistales bacterium 57_84]KUK88816.1 MAG: Nucleoid-associated protein [Synergistales bacterium 58_81]HBG14426.1 YbaB/EbfC family nucleoid-associated protein [Synergistaceae bacterium]HCP07922.1 YbaB/EbfC family nucleoid-associated protein [Synergistaceae bacterium]